VRQAAQEGHPAVLVEIPLNPTDVEQEVIGEILERLRDEGLSTLAQRVAAQPTFVAALRLLMSNGALVVVDDFQRLLDSRAQPSDPLGSKLQQLSRRAPDEGCLWLVTNRVVDPVWTESFYEALLEAPTELTDSERIVLEAIGRDDAEGRFPLDRRLEVVRRVGANPRVLRLLGNLLRIYPLEELLGPPGDVPAAPADSRLTISIERNLLAKAEEGLPDDAKQLLRFLSILRGPASWELIEAAGEPLGDIREQTRALRERFLLEIRGNHYHLHPAVREVEGPRLREDARAWRSVHRRVGVWYAEPLSKVNGRTLGDADLALRLAGARYHFLEAGATDLLRGAMRGLRGYFKRRFGWSSPRPTSVAERDARISLLEVYLQEPGEPDVEYTYARLLRLRAAPGDFDTAVSHAERATLRQDFHNPWVLWIQVVREVHGLQAAVHAAQKAVEEVAPEKGLYAVYQLLGAFLDHLGRAGDAVDVLLGATARVEGNAQRLVEEALHLAAPEPDVALLERVRQWASEHRFQGGTVALADVLLLERQGSWQQAAMTARVARKDHPSYLHLTIHEALCWLGSSNPGRAQETLDQFPGGLRCLPREGSSWLAALVALQQGYLAQAADLLATYLGTEGPSTEAGIRAALLREWDHRVATVGEPNPALMNPVLPKAVTGLDRDIRRPQYGPPALPQHHHAPEVASRPLGAGLRFLAVATEWQSGQGGLSTLNRKLCCGLAAAGTRVVCLVAQASERDRREAAAQGVTVIEATAAFGRPTHEALFRKPALPDGFLPDFIIGHGRVTGPAAQVLVEDHFPTAKRLHFIHMSPDEIEWYKLDREDDVGVRAEERTQAELDLGRTAACVVAVGPRLFGRYVRDLSAYKMHAPIRLDPGFDSSDVASRTPPPGEPWSIMLLGRLEDSHLKGLDIAARAIGSTASRRAAESPALELLVRGAPPNSSDQLQSELRGWSKLSRVVVRPYTSEGEVLDADLRRATLLLMPSRSEGFGLVGLEAIVSGTPALISAESGLGMLLGEVLEPEQANRFVVPISTDDAQIIEDWSRSIEGVLRDREAAFRRAAEVRGLLCRQKTWAAAIAGLMAELSAI
jgi:glycosyltransferase involved in cell wall biosynthesis